MDPEFWHQRWAANEIGFHRDTEHELLLRHIGRLELARGARVFLPLCGKTLDMAWLMGEGYRVVGCELSEHAVTQFFEALGVTPRVERCHPFALYRADAIDILVGDAFDLRPEILGCVDAVYDRAALVALPEAMRVRYAALQRSLTGLAPQLLITISYAPGALPGPPFSLTEQDVRKLYGEHYRIEERDSIPLASALEGGVEIVETLWYLSGGR